jgi:hypothetical protein
MIRRVSFWDIDADRPGSDLICFVQQPIQDSRLLLVKGAASAVGPSAVKDANPALMEQY